MGATRARKFAAVAVAIALLAAASTLVAFAASGSRASATPRPMKYACAWNLYNAKKVLHFVARPSSCQGRGKTLVKFQADYPVYTCRKEHGGFTGRPRQFPYPLGIYSRGPAGLMRLVNAPSDCAPPSQPNETPHTLPGSVARTFCAAKRGGELRWIADPPSCNNREFAVRLAKLKGANPLARNDAATTDEDHGTTIAVLGNDRVTPTSSSSAGLQVASVDTTGTKGHISVNADGTIGYDPASAFQSLKVGQSGTDSFKYRAKKGARVSAPATVSLTINGLNDAPIVADGAALTDKEHTKQIAVLAGAADLDGDPLSVASVDTTGTKGQVTINPDGTVTYDPNHRFDGLGPTQSAHDTFKFKANDGHADSNVATIDVTVTGINKPPVLAGIESTALSYTSGAAAVPISSAVTVSDPDNANLTGATIKVASGFVSGEDTLSFANTAAITGNYDSSTGVLTLTGSAPVSDYETALRSVKYKSSPATPTGTKTMGFQVDDGGPSNHASNTVTRDVAVTNDDHAPTDIGLAPSSVAENQPSGTTVGTLTSTDSDGSDSHTYSLVLGTGSGDNGSFAISGDTLKTAASFDFETKSSYSIRVKTDDGRGGTFEKQLTVSVTDANDAPTDLSLSNASVAENQPSGTTVGTLSATDQDSGDSHTYSLVTGTGDTDNSKFQISGSTLQTNASFDFETKSSYSIRVKADDGNGGTFEKQLTISVADANDSPTNLALSSSSVPENSALGTTIGNFSTTDQDTGDTHTYSLVSGTGSTDNGSFTISGNALQTNTLLDFETKSSYSIRVQTDDAHGGTFQKQFTITVTDANDAPSDIGLSNSTVTENQPSGTTVGTLSSTDQDGGDTHTYSLVSGSGSTDNAQFQISGSTLQTATSLDFEAGSTRSIRVQSDDGHGGTFQKVLTITVSDANDTPTDIGLSNASVAENQPVATTVGTLSSTDQDSGDTHTYSLVSGTGSTDNASFQISGSTLQTNASFDFESKSSFSIRVQTDDGHGGTFEKVFTISITDVNDVPTDIGLSNGSVAENQPSGTTVGTLSSTDQDSANAHTYSLVTGTGDTDNGQFQISGSTLQTNASFDFETKSSYSIRVKTDDGHGGTFEKQFTINVTNANDAPTGLALSKSTVVSGKPSGTTVGTLSSTDQDAGDSHTYSLVSGTGSDDNSSFQISGSDLQTATSVPTGTYHVRVRTDDGHGGTFEKQFTITANPNTDPTDIGLSPSNVDENQPSGTTVGTLSTTDADAGDSHTYSLVSGTGSTDNASFQISGSTLQTAASLDFEAGATRSVRIQTDDGHGGTFEKVFTITVNNTNDAPTDISLSNSSVNENQPSGTTVGSFSSTDQDSADGHTYSLVSGTGSTDNGSFTIDASGNLKTAALFDFETKSSYSIRVKTDDGHGGTFEKQFTVTVNDLNDAPTDLSLSPSSVPENSPLGTTVGNFSSTDQDQPANTFTYTLVSGAGSTDNGSFTINGTALQTNTLLDFETKSSYSIRVQTDDGHGGTFQKQLTITVTDQNDAPSDIGLSSSSVNENQASGTTVGTFSTTDQDSGDTHTYSLVSGTGSTDNGAFTISGSTLKTNATFDYETKNSYSIRVQTDDGHGGTFQKQFTISVNDINDPPTDIGLSTQNIDENQPSGSNVGTLSSTDQDVPANSFTYTLVSGAGSTDNASFTISGSTLKSAASFDFETKNSYSIRVQTDDGHGGTFQKQFTITINDVNDAPVANADSYSGVVGNTKAQLGTSSSGPVVTLTGNKLIANDTDQDATFPHTVSAVAETVSSTGGGSATINTDGSFTYTPPAGAENTTDTFTYHATDGSLTSAGTVTMHIANVRVWYVDNNLGSNGDGRSTAPFNTLSNINGAGGSGDADGSGDTIFLYHNGGTYGGGLPLESSQKLIGQPQGLSVDNGNGNQNLVTASGTNPTVTGANNVDAVVLANSTDIERVDVTGSTGTSAAIRGTSVTSATIGSSTTLTGGGGGGVILSGAASGTISIPSTISNSSGKSVSVQNRSSGSVTFTGTVTDTGTGILLNSNTGASIDFSGKLALSTGTNSAFSATGGGTVTNTSGGATPDSTLTTTTGTALNVANTTIGAGGLKFKSISANGATNGIVLNTTGTTAGLTVAGDGSQTAGLLDRDGSGGTIQSTSQDAVLLTNANATFKQLNITNAGWDGVQATGSGNVTLSAVDINHPGNAGPAANGSTGNPSGFGGGNGFYVENGTGTYGFDNNSRVINWQSSQSNAILLHNTSADFTSFTVDHALISTSATGGVGFHANLNGTTDGQVSLTNSEFTLIDQNAAQVLNNGSGTIRAIVQGNNFHDADATGGDGNNTLYLANSADGHLNFTVGGAGALGNTFHNLARLTTLAGVVQVDAAGGSASTPAGGVINGTITHNNIWNDSGFTNGRRAIDVQVEADSHNLGQLAVAITNNTVNNVGGNAIHVSVVSVGGGSVNDGNWTITGNSLGAAGTNNGIHVGPDNTDSASAIEFETNVDSFTSGADTANKLQIANNTGVDSANNATGAVVDVTNLWGSAGSGTTALLQATITNNNLTNLDTSGTGHVLDVLNSSAGDGETLNLNITGNNTTLGASTAGEIRLRQLNGAFNIQGGSGAVSANNNGDTVATTGSFGTVGSVPLPTAPSF